MFGENVPNGCKGRRREMARRRERDGEKGRKRETEREKGALMQSISALSPGQSGDE